MNPETDYILRRLSWVDKALETHYIGEDALLTEFRCPLVILGNPGMSKTRLMEKLGTSDSIYSKL